MNGTRILEREVAGDIEALGQAEVPKGCKAYGLVRSAVVRALRMSEDARHVARQNRGLLLALIVLNLLGSGQDVGQLLLALVKLLGR